MMAIDANVLKDRCKKDENYPKKVIFCLLVTPFIKNVVPQKYSPCMVDFNWCPGKAIIAWFQKNVFGIPGRFAAARWL